MLTLDECSAKIMALTEDDGVRFFGYAQTYCLGMNQAVREYGERGVRAQCLYVLSNLEDWTTPEACAVKDALADHGENWTEG